MTDPIELSALATSNFATPINRPGELLNVAMEVAEKARRVELIEITDPRDGTRAPAYLCNDRVSVISANDFDAFRIVPTERKGTASHTRLDSFIAHTNRFKDVNSAVFASDDPATPNLITVFDYHPEGPNHYIANGQTHRAKYAFPLSDEWKAWSASNAKSMAMSDFAAFLEDRIVDVVADADPASPAAKDFVAKTGGNIASPSKLITIARGLQVNEASVLREARNLSTGEAELVFQSEHLDANGAKLTLPNLFMICIPVFARSPVFYQLLARFRYRKAGSGITFSYELWRADLVFEQAFSEACDLVREQTALPLFVGKPEV